MNKKCKNCGGIKNGKTGSYLCKKCEKEKHRAERIQRRIGQDMVLLDKAVVEICMANIEPKMPRPEKWEANILSINPLSIMYKLGDIEIVGGLREGGDLWFFNQNRKYLAQKKMVKVWKIVKQSMIKK